MGLLGPRAIFVLDLVMLGILVLMIVYGALLTMRGAAPRRPPVPKRWPR